MGKIILTGMGAHYVPSDKDSDDEVNINDYNFGYVFSF